MTSPVSLRLAGLMEEA